MVEADLTFRLPSEGGRAIPPGVLVGLQYCLHIVIGDPNQRAAIVGEGRVLTERYLGVGFTSGPRLVPNGVQIQVQMMLAFWPHPVYDTVQPGATFTLRERDRIVGHGRITRRWTERWEPAAQR